MKVHILRRIVALVLAIMLMVPTIASAKGTYKGYTYDVHDRDIPSINGYLYKDSINGYNINAGPFNNIQDMHMASDDSLYIVDSGNNRIVHIDKYQQLIGIYGTTEGEGKLKGPKGIYVTSDGTMYVADTANSRIVVFDRNGEFVKDFKDPQSPLLGEGFLYLPSKIIVDKRGYMFIVSDGLYQGLLQLNSNGEFAGLFGANHVPFSITRLLKNLLATNEQKAQLASQSPPGFSNLFQDKKGFIYTTTLGVETHQIKRLSAVGVDTLENTSNLTAGKGRFGDYRMVIRNSSIDDEWTHQLFPAFFDITVDDQGFITALDQISGKAFQYDSMGNLLFIFGGLGNRDGLFMTPTTLEISSEGMIFIGDRARNRIDRFQITSFGETVHKAATLYNKGQYEESSEPWHEVLRLNSNYDLAYVAIGKALYKQEKYAEAMHYFELGWAKDEYSLAYLEHRKKFVRDHFIYFFFGTIGLFVAFTLANKWRKRRKAKIKSRKSERSANRGEAG